jgi:hypothetical protein
MKYIKKTRVSEMIRLAKSRGELEDVIANVANEVEELIYELAPMIWEGVE